MGETAKTIDPPETEKPAKGEKAEIRSIDLLHPSLYLNRELSWLRFNERVLEEAGDDRRPLLERVKFLSIFAGNLDEFFMIRVSGLRKQLEAGTLKAPPDGMTPAEQLAQIRMDLEPSLFRAYDCWRDVLHPALEEAGIRVLGYDDLKNRQQKLLRRHFKKEILPILTPLAFDPGHPFPHISNLSINLAVVVNDPDQGQRFARLKVPQVVPRLLRIPSEDRADEAADLGLGDLSANNLVWMEEVVAANLDLLFPGLEIVSAWPFRVTRDADLEIEEDEAADLLTAMREVVGQRHFGSAIRLEVAAEMPKLIRQTLERNLEVAPYQVYATEGPLGLADLGLITRLEVPDLKEPPFLPRTPPSLSGEVDVFAHLARDSVLLFHPYDSFGPVVDLIRAAASDPAVVAIKQTLYRVGPNSPVVQALMEARQNGKQVAVLVELKARFDEENNITWARSLERAGVHVVYGLVGLKTHAKMCLIVRREKKGIARYLHLGTGNYNPVTATLYTDHALLTSDSELAKDVCDLFNGLTGYSRKTSYRKLLVAPTNMRSALLARIEREIEHHRRDGGGHLAFKMNSLVDQACIEALYRASQAGVRVDLQVRGICCLRPGLPGVSETIRVTSVVGRFLEHTRIYYFRNGGDEEIFLGSADLMPRNLDGRVEILFPVDPLALKKALKHILDVHLADNVNARLMDADGQYRRLEPGDDPPVDSQSLMIGGHAGWPADEG